MAKSNYPHKQRNGGSNRGALIALLVLLIIAAAVFLPGSEALTYPAVLWPGLVLAATVPTGWAFWALAEQPAPLPPEQLLEKQKPPYRVPDTEVLFVSRSLDLS